MAKKKIYIEIKLLDDTVDIDRIRRLAISGLHHIADVEVTSRIGLTGRSTAHASELAEDLIQGPPQLPNPSRSQVISFANEIVSFIDEHVDNFYRREQQSLARTDVQSEDGLRARILEAIGAEKIEI